MSWDALHAEVVAEFWQPNTWDVLAQLAADSRSAILSEHRERQAARRITKRTEGKPCPGCGQHFENRARGWLRKFCSDSCRKKHHNKGKSRAGWRKKAAA